MNRCGFTGIIDLFYSSDGFLSVSAGALLRSPAARGSGARSCRAADSEVEFGKAALENLFWAQAEITVHLLNWDKWNVKISGV